MTTWTWVRARPGAIAVVLALLLAGGLLLRAGQVYQQSRPEESATQADRYAERVPYSASIPRLPDRPGPMAMTFTDNSFGQGFGVGVTPGGRTYRLSGGFASLSRNGRVLLSERSGPLALLTTHDLVTGARHTFTDVDDRFSSGPRHRSIRYQVNALYTSSPAWAADGSSVLLALRDRQHPDHDGHAQPAVLDLASGSVRFVGHGVPAGYRQPSEAVTVAKTGDQASVRITATVTDLRDGSSHDVPLHLADPWQGRARDRLDASVSPDGSMLLLAEDEPHGSTTRLHRFLLASGRELPVRTVTHRDGFGGLAWLGQDPVVPVKDTGTGGHPGRSLVVGQQYTRSLVAIHPRLQSYGIIWAQDALSGGHAWTLFGTWSYIGFWYWWLGLPVLAVLLLADLVLLAADRLGRRRVQPTTP